MAEQRVETLQKELALLRKRVDELEEEKVAAEPISREWTRQYYLSYYATTGFFLGMFAAVASLLFNVVGAWLMDLHPLQLIRTYLTFGMGERALHLQLRGGEEGLALIIGIKLYIATGMLLGSLFQVVLSRLADRGTVLQRLVIASVLGLAVWVVNYYLLLSWIQPWLFGGNWIVGQIPWWVGALTHLVFGWTMALLYPLGAYQPYQVRMD
jgi:hypothetical protein